jgi:phospholipid N-methyltransferase
MFNNEFYPTPQSMIDKMLSGVDFRTIRTVLEPSAGKGDIAEEIKEMLNNKAA